MGWVGFLVLLWMWLDWNGMVDAIDSGDGEVCSCARGGALVLWRSKEVRLLRQELYTCSGMP